MDVCRCWCRSCTGLHLHSVFFQRVIAACVDEPVNASAYASNRQLLTQGLDELGYHYIAPDGAFYL